jgi:hypothetical protein
MKKFLLAFLLLLLCNYAGSNNQAGEDGRFSIGGELAAPTATFAKQQGIGYGATMRLEAPVGNQTALMFTFGYLQITTHNPPALNTFSLDTGPSFLIPVQLGLKVYFQEQQSGFYLMMNGGAHGYRGAIEDSTGGHKIKFAVSYAPEFGCHLENVDIGLRVQFINTPDHITSYIGFRLAYVFGDGVRPTFFGD